MKISYFYQVETNLMENRKMIYTSRLTIIGLLLMVMAFLILATGNSSLEPFFVLFPYGSLALNFTEELWLIILLMLIQYPFYGFLLDKSPTRIKLVALIIVVIHIAFVVFEIRNMNTGFK